MVFDTSGVHAVNVDYCDCPSPNDNILHWRTQLLRHCWFPVTFSRPNTVITFDCLDTFYEHTLQGKENLYDFYHSLLWKTDNANVSDTIVSVSFSSHHCLSLMKLPSSIDIRRYIESSESGETWWHSNVQDVDMIQRILEACVPVAWQ